MKINVHALYTIDSIKNGKQWRMGSGFVFLRNDWLVTAKHVVWDGELQQMRSPLFLISTDPSVEKKLIPITKVYLHPDFDLAVLETPFSLCELPYVAAQKTIKKNKQVVGLGYSPNDSEFAAINFRIVSIESYEIEEREWNSGTEEMFVFKFDSSERGNSGGPIFGDDATILGVISQSIVDETTDNAYIVRATSIRPLVDMTSIETDWIVKFSNSSNFFNPTN